MTASEIPVAPDRGLTVALLGPPDVRVEGVPVSVDTRKATALLAYLVVTDRTHRRDTLAALLWPEHDHTRARAALRRTLSALNTALGGRWITADRETIGLEGERWVDLDVFRDLLDRDPAPSNRVATLEAAVSLHRGGFMEGFTLRDSPEFDDWQYFTAEGLRREVGSAYERLTAARAEAGDLDGAIEAAEAWLRLDVLNEPAHRELMLLYARTGRRDAAIRRYRECVSVLDAELGVPPLEETTELYERIKADATPAPPPPTTREQPRTPQRFPMVGRDPDWRRLLEAYAAVGPDGRLAVIRGEAGIGKTRIAEELAAHIASAGGTVLAARCHPEERHLAYAPVAELLRAIAPERPAAVPDTWLAEAARLVPELTDGRPAMEPAPPLESPGGQGRFFQGIVRVLEAGVGTEPPGLLFVDDLQWADDASFDVLGYLVRRLRDRPVLVLLSHRTEGSDETDRLAALTEDAAAVVHLDRLGPDDVAELASSTQAPDELADRLYSETEGVPLFCIEYLSRMAAGTDPWTLTEGTRELLHSRIAPLDGPARQVLGTAAVIGRSFDLDLVLRASGRSEDEVVGALEDLVAWGLVREVDARGEPLYDFAHDKLRSLVYEETGLARRRLLHRRIADALGAGRGPEGAVAGLVAHHHRLGGRDADAARAFAAAGDHSRSLGANTEALEAYRAAIALGHPEVAALHEQIGDLETLRGEYPASLDAYEAAAARYEDRERLAAVEHKLGAVHLRQGDRRTADVHFEAALDTLPRGTGRALRARVLADRSLGARRDGDIPKAAELAEAALAEAEAAEDTAALAQVHNLLGILARATGDPDGGREHLERSLKLAESIDDAGARIASLNNLALVHRDAGDVERGLELARTALGACALVGDRHREAAIHNNIADLLRAAGRTDDAMSHLKQAVEIFAEIGEPASGSAEIWKLVDW